MQKEQLCREIGRRLGLPAKEVLPFVEVFMATVGRALARKETVQLRGFGTFYTRESKARRIKPPCSRSYVHVPAHAVPKFRPHKQLVHYIHASNR